MKLITQIIPISVLLGFSIIFGCSTNTNYKKSDFTKGDAVFSIQIQDPNNPYIKLRSYGIFKHIDLKETSVTDTLKSITEGYYTFSDRMHACGFYGKPNSTINVKLNTKDFVRSIEFSGDFVKENNYLKDFFLLTRDLGRTLSVQHLAYLDEKTFRSTIDSIKSIRLKLLAKHNQNNRLDNHFNYIEEKRLYYEWASRMETYEAYRKYALDDESYTVSKDFYNYRKEIVLNDRDLIIAPSYHYYLESYYQSKANAITKKDSSDVYVNYLKVVEEKVKDSIIKERLLYSYANLNLRETKKSDQFIKAFNQFSKNKFHKQELRQKYAELNRLNPGMPAPEFNLTDSDGKMVKLSDLKGNYVYIDIWATWCKPCIMEMPFFEKLKEKYINSGITFVSISTNSFDKDWLNFLKINKPKGIQLFAGDNEDFKILFKAQEVPQYLLINPEGKISTAIAPRPSETELIELLFDRISEKQKK